MMNFSEWVGLKEAAGDAVHGPGIKAMQEAMRDMASRGAPREYNDYGFNKQDWMAYQDLLGAGHIDSISVPIGVARVMLKILSHYQNTQLTNYRQISSMVMQDLNSVAGTTASTAGDKVIVFDRSPREYGKIKVYIPHGLDRGMTIQINRILDEVLESEGERQSPDNYGKMAFPRFKKFTADKASIHTYRIHPTVMDRIVALFRHKGLEVEFESGSQGVQPSEKPTTPPAETRGEPDVTIVGKESNRWGNKVAVKFNYERSRGVFQRMKDAGLSPKGISYDFDRKMFLINIDDKTMFDSVVAHIKEAGLDATPLEEFAKSDMGHTPGTTGTGSDVIKKEGVIRYSDAPGDSITIRTDVRGLPHPNREFVRESIQYTFPEYRYNRDNPDDWHYVVRGSYKQYVTFGRLLARFGYPVDELRDIVRAKLDSGRLTKTEWEGKHDKDKEFQDSIQEKVPESMVDLYDEQKFGVAFLYGRDSAILGDETGFGKSVQLITAAALRMRTSSKPTLIITLKATQKQFADEIVRVMGEKERSQISLDPMNPKRWTVVRYSDFSGGKDERNKKVQQHIDNLKKAGFGVAILDELHKVKHAKSQRSENIASVIDSIPTRWGASATVSSNKPMDVKNQLLMMGHQLGKVSPPKFKKDFAGMVAGGYGGSLKKSDNEEDEIRAAERLNKWLNLSGVYVRREKGDIREMPELKVGNESTSINQGKFQSLYSAKVQTYKDPDLAVSKLIAAREAIAQLKTDESTRRVLDIVKAGEGKPAASSKVVVFTNFIEAGRQLVDKISAGLKAINPSYGVVTYLSDTAKKEREQVKKKFTDDPNLKVLIMSMKMGGTGIDFPNAAQSMVINDFDWTPESAEQSEGRIYRINTDHPVRIQYVVGEGLDKELFEKVQRKREIAAIIQKYRREYHDNESAPEALRKIVDAQKEMRKLDDDMAKIIATNLPGAEKALDESFSSYIKRVQYFSDALFSEE